MKKSAITLMATIILGTTTSLAQPRSGYNTYQSSRDSRHHTEQRLNHRRHDNRPCDMYRMGHTSRAHRHHGHMVYTHHPQVYAPVPAVHVVHPTPVPVPPSAPCPPPPRTTVHVAPTGVVAGAVIGTVIGAILSR